MHVLRVGEVVFASLGLKVSFSMWYLQLIFFSDDSSSDDSDSDSDVKEKKPATAKAATPAKAKESSGEHKDVFLCLFEKKASSVHIFHQFKRNINAFSSFLWPWGLILNMYP